jgi:hypothetical protein
LSHQSSRFVGNWRLEGGKQRVEADFESDSTSESLLNKIVIQR